MSDIADRVKKIVVEHLGVEEDKVTENASFIDDLGADSLDTVELVMAFEEEFGIEIPDDAAETIQTFGERGRVHHQGVLIVRIRGFLRQGALPGRPFRLRGARAGVRGCCRRGFAKGWTLGRHGGG